MERQRIYIGLGSNLGDREAHLCSALRALEDQFELRRVSSLYRTAPLGPVQDQPDFLNVVAELDSSVDARDALRCCLAIEEQLGRVRKVDKGPRVIDLDLLLVGARVESWPELDLPHPGLTERAFVLEPLLELCPRLSDPRDGRPLVEHLAALPEQGVVRLGPTPYP